MDEGEHTLVTQMRAGLMVMNAEGQLAADPRKGLITVTQVRRRVLCGPSCVRPAYLAVGLANSCVTISCRASARRATICLST